MPFVKLDCKILDSTIWLEQSDTRICWITMLAMANSNGLVESTAPGIAKRAMISLRSTRRAIQIFESKDKDSRDNTSGERIKRVEGGYQILNYQKYRETDYTVAERMQKYRERQKNALHRNDRNKTVTTVTVTQAEAEAYTEVKTKNKAQAPVLPDWIPVETWNEFILMRQKMRKGPTLKAIELLIGKLKLLRDIGNDPKLVLEQSILNSWQGLFPLRNERLTNGKQGTGRFTKPESSIEAITRIMREADGSGVADSPGVHRGKDRKPDSTD